VRLIPDFGSGANGLLDSVLYRFSVIGVPVLIVAVTLLAVFGWRAEYEVGGSTPVQIRVLEDERAALTPDEALSRLARVQPVAHYDTRLSESPFWFAFRAETATAPTVIELPSRHAQVTQCWSAPDLRPLGTAERGAESSGEIRPVKAGFAIDPGAQPPGAGSSVGPRSWARSDRGHAVPASQLEVSNEKFHRNTGLLDGGLIVLALFVLVTALINREWMYVLFATWLVASLRLGAISAGWDTHWLEKAVPQEWIFPLRKYTVAANYVLTWVLFSTLLKDELKRVGHSC